LNTVDCRACGGGDTPTMADPPAVPPEPSERPPVDRLDSWKEIAAYDSDEGPEIAYRIQRFGN